MKQVIVVFFLMMGSGKAQNLFTANAAFPKTIKEEYLMSLFRECRLVYCDRDSLAADQWVKKIEVEFFDTTHFFAAYFTSSVFTKQQFMKGEFQCDFLQFDDGGDGWDLYEKDLQTLSSLRKLLTQLLQETPFVQYAGPCPGTEGKRQKG